VAILRDGRLVLVEHASELTEDDIVRNMVGRELGEVFGRHPAATDRVVLEVRDIHSDVHHGVSFDIKAGEIVGFAGLIGAGRSELAKVIFGEMPKTGGEVIIEGREVHIGQPANAIAEGIGFAPEDRKREGLVLIRSVLENATMAILRRLTRFRIVQRRREREVATEYVERLNVRTPSIDQVVGKLSGGNQQKVVLARWLAAKPKVLILDEPTRGIDVGAKTEIYRLIDALANEGLAIMFISSELPEILGMSDRIIVMQGGRITGELPGPGSTEEQVLELAMHEHLAASRAAGPAGAEKESR
jgi:L-arabinose transport system ATP-binding protein